MRTPLSSGPWGSSFLIFNLSAKEGPSLCSSGTAPAPQFRRSLAGVSYTPDPGQRLLPTLCSVLGNSSVPHMLRLAACCLLSGCCLHQVSPLRPWTSPPAQQRCRGPSWALTSLDTGQVSAGSGTSGKTAGQDLHGSFGPTLLGSSCPSSVPPLGRGLPHGWKPTCVSGSHVPTHLERTEAPLGGRHCASHTLLHFVT